VEEAREEEIEAEEATITKAEEASITKAEEAEEVEEATITKAEEATITKAEEATITKEDKIETLIRREELLTIETCKSKIRGMTEMTTNPTKSLESKEEADPITKEVAVEAITKRAPIIILD